MTQSKTVISMQELLKDTQETLTHKSKKLKAFMAHKQVEALQAKEAYEEALKAWNVVHTALTQIAPTNAVVATKNPKEVSYQKENVAQLHNFIVSFMRTNTKQQWKLKDLRQQAVTALSTADEEAVVRYEDVQRIILKLRHAGKVARPAHGKYMWAEPVTNKSTKGHKREKSVASKLPKRTKATIKREVRGVLSSGGEYSVKNILDRVAFANVDLFSKLDSSDNSIYQFVWNNVRQLRRNNQVVKVGNGRYRWTKAGSARAEWMTPADKLLAQYADLSASDIVYFLKDGKHPATSLNAVQKYLERQLKRGIIKRTERGRYAAID